MTWLNFLFWITGIYGLYYLANILIDVTAKSRSPTDQNQLPELTFSEVETPQRPEPEPAKPVNATVAQPAIIASGGVILKDLFNLARKEAIHFTGPVTF